MSQVVSSWELPATPENFARLQQVVKDLQAVHDPRTDNSTRFQAQSVFIH